MRPRVPHSRYAGRETQRGPLRLYTQSGVKAHGECEAVLQGPLGLDKVKIISLQLNSGPIWAVLTGTMLPQIWGFCIWSWAFLTQLIKVFHMPLRPFFFFFKSIPLYTPLITIGLDPAHRADDGGGWGGTEMFATAADSSLVYAFFSSAPPVPPPSLPALPWKSIPMEGLSGSWDKMQALT